MLITLRYWYKILGPLAQFRDGLSLCKCSIHVSTALEIFIFFNIARQTMYGRSDTYTVNKCHHTFISASQQTNYAKTTNLSVLYM